MLPQQPKIAGHRDRHLGRSRHRIGVGESLGFLRGKQSDQFFVVEAQ